LREQSWSLTTQKKRSHRDESLPAGRAGTRLRPVIDWIPECLVPIRGRPVLELVLPHILGKMAAYPVDGCLFDIRTMSNYQKAQITWPGLAPSGV
jgi:NDP-sugar pyrophosphorylase family protein